MEDKVYDYEREIPAGFYDRVYRQRDGVRYCWHDLKFRAVQACLARVGRVLDVGCGPGTFIGNYLQGTESFGLDISAAQIEYATRTYGSSTHRFSTQPLTSVCEAGERFDAVTAIELIEHLSPDNALQVLTEARTLLAPGGLLVLTTPNYRSLWPLIEFGVNAVSAVAYEEQHINKYSRGRLREHLAAAGFRDISITTTVGLAPFAAVLGLRAANVLHALEAGVTHLGVGNLLLATARP